MHWVLLVYVLGAGLLVTGAAQAELAGRVTVIDGDTFDVAGTRVRLYGIDAPETAQRCETHSGEVWNCGAWVTQVVRARLESEIVRCTPRGTDRYGRVLARCVSGQEDIAGRLVADGLAFAYRRYSMDYAPLERQASARGAGLHGSKVQAPESYRRRTAAETGPAGCAIKGNIARDGTRIFHRPGQQHYARTRIDESKGERWFCTPADAEAAGWRAARR